MSTNDKIAILIDGDNAESALIENYLEEAGRFGRVTVKRIYADWTNPNMKSWKAQLNKFAIRPVQKFAYTTGKNSTDTELIIGAMDLLHSKHVKGFCIVSSDSDYTGLAHRIREEGMFVIGIGKSHTPEAFVKACGNFIFTEILQPADPIEVNSTTLNDGRNKITTQKLTNGSSTLNTLDKFNVNLIDSLQESGVAAIDLKQIDIAYQKVCNIDTGLALLSRFSQALRELDTTFDPRNFGHKSFRKFCESLLPYYETVIHEDGITMSLRTNARS